MELRLDEEGLGCRRHRVNNSNRREDATVRVAERYLHVQSLLGVLPHEPVRHYDQVSCLAGRVRGQGGGRVADGALQVQRAAGKTVA